MMQAISAAISGLDAQQTMLNTTANNLANVDTIGYKAQRTNFSDQLSQMLGGGSGATTNNGGTNPMQVGMGVQVSSIDNEMGDGSLENTGNPLDVAIQGNGFLRVGNGTPPSAPPYTSGTPSNIEYTRAGDLTTSPGGFLTTSTGQYVIGRNAVPTGTAPNITYAPGTSDSYIKIPTGSTNVAIGQDGSVTYTDQNASSATFGQTVNGGYTSLATFPSASGLTRAGNSMWTASASSGTPTVGTPNTAGFGSTLSGSLEMSNVDMATEFTNMIQAQSGYEANSRVITTADNMMQTLTQIPPA
jgi:flagellar hook protein FlgE